MGQTTSSASVEPDKAPQASVVDATAVDATAVDATTTSDRSLSRAMFVILYSDGVDEGEDNPNHDL